MAATKGNQWWRLRSKHGRDKTFSDPQILLESCFEYFEATDKRKWITVDFVGKDAIEVHRPVDTPYTITGLCIFLDIDLTTWHRYKNDDNKDYYKVISHVEQIIYTQKLEGATVGTYNSNIVARDLGLKDKQDIQINENRKTIGELFPSDEEFNEADK